MDDDHNESLTVFIDIYNQVQRDGVFGELDEAAEAMLWCVVDNLASVTCEPIALKDGFTMTPQGLALNGELLDRNNSAEFSALGGVGAVWGPSNQGCENEAILAAVGVMKRCVSWGQMAEAVLAHPDVAPYVDVITVTEG